MILRRSVLRASAGLVLFSLAAALFASGGAEPVDPATLVGELIYLEGDVTLNDADVDIGAEVRPGDRIVTGPDSLAEVTFGKRNILQFRENTSSAIEPAWAGVELSQGTVAAVLNGLERLGFGGSNRFEVTTDTAVMAVRGTTFFVEHRDSDEAYFCTCHGKLHLETPDGELAEDTEAYHHDAVWYVRTPDGIRSFPSGLHYHDDDMLNDIAYKAGTRVNWKD